MANSMGYKKKYYDRLSFFNIFFYFTFVALPNGLQNLLNLTFIRFAVLFILIFFLTFFIGVHHLLIQRLTALLYFLDDSYSWVFLCLALAHQSFLKGIQDVFARNEVIVHDVLGHFVPDALAEVGQRFGKD
jgi:hypothetical protein